MSRATPPKKPLSLFLVGCLLLAACSVADNAAEVSGPVVPSPVASLPTGSVKQAATSHVQAVTTVATIPNRPRPQPSGGGFEPGTNPPTIVPLQAQNAPAGRILLHTPDNESLVQFRTETTDGQIANASDVLVSSDSLEVLVKNPLEQHGTLLSLKRPDGRVALAFPWPSKYGFSELIVDLPAPGEYDLLSLAASSQLAELELLAAQEPRLSSTVTAFRGRVSALSAVPLTIRGAAARPVVNDLLDATMDAVSTLAKTRSSRKDFVVGASIDDTSTGSSVYKSAAAVAGSRKGSVRLVFDLESTPADQTAAIKRAKSAGLEVVGQLLDSESLSTVSVTEYKKRAEKFISTLPGVDVWEVGNEVNGSWTGRNVAAKVAAANEIAHKYNKPTMLTVYWQMGEEDPQNSMGSFLESNKPLVAHVDILAVSLYPGAQPLGAALPRMIRTLERYSSNLAISELGYGSADLDTFWWAFDKNPARGQLRVAAFYQRALLAFPSVKRGAYWWYFLEEASKGRLHDTLVSAAR